MEKITEPSARAKWKTILIRIGQAVLVLAALAVCTFFVLAFSEPAGKPPFVYGVTYRYTNATSLGLDWKKTYTAMLDDLNVKHVRLPVYWENIQPQRDVRDYADLDFEVNTAQQHGATVVLALGRKVPGWPECHIPSWAEKLSIDDQQAALNAHILATVERYKDSPALEYWQVENEPFLPGFGTCPQYDAAKTLDQEISFVRGLDPNHKIIVTDSGEINFWIDASARGDILGSTLYRDVYNDHFNSYLHYYIPALWYRAKGALVHILHPGKEIISSEVQAEPWTTAGIEQTPFSEQAITLHAGSITANAAYGHAAGFSTEYFWGVEYWYWAAQHGHPEFLAEAKKIFSTH